jgi:hypothetical protein
VNTKNADRPIQVEDDDIRPDTSRLDWSTAAVGRRTRKPGEKTEIRLDGAIEYQLRLIPSTKLLGRFTTTLDAWPAIIAAAESGRSPRTLSLDAIGAEGKRWHMAAGPFLISFARLNNGEPHPNERGAPRARRRVAEG